MKAKYNDGVFVGYHDTGGFTSSARGLTHDLESVLRSIVRPALIPANAAQIEPWLAELSVIAPSRAADPATDELRMTAYATRLSAYPPDVVHAALLGTTWRFFPSWAELEDACEQAVAPRRAMEAEIERRIIEDGRKEHGDQAEPVSKRDAEDAASRARVQAMVADFTGRARMK